MKILALVLFALEEVIIATSSLGPVSLLEIKWAKEMGLMGKNTSLGEAAKEITAARLVRRRYGMKVMEVSPQIIKRAKTMGLPPSFARDFALEILNLRAFVKERFGKGLENYRKWRDEELSRENFHLLPQPKR